MNTFNTIRSIACALCAFILGSGTAFSQATATWTGAAADFQWNNSANWSWSSGSGLPTATTNVVIHNISAPIIIGPNAVASCKDLTIDGGNSNQIEIGANTKLNVYGSIIQNGPHTYLGDASIASGSATGAELIFTGSQSQVLKSMMITMTNVHINKTGGNVIVDTSCRLLIKDTLFLESTSVAIGNAAKGNLEIRRGILIRDVHGAATKLPAYSEAQIPPHVVCTQYPVMVNEQVSYIVGDVLSSTGDEGINGTILFPVGENDSSYTPVTITQTGTNTNAWNVHITKPKPASCTSNPINGAQAVKHGFNVVPLERNLSGTLSTISVPATITMSYNTTNSQDVPAGYNATNNTKAAYTYSQTQGCWNKLTGSMQSGTNFKTVTVANCTAFEQFAIGAAGNVGVPNVQNNTEVTIYPNPIVTDATVKVRTALKTQVTLRVTDLTGKRLIESTHLIDKGEQNIRLDAGPLPAGSYLLHLTTADGETVSKIFVKQ